MRAPSLDDIALLARRTWDHVPAVLRDMAGDIAIRVEEFPDDDTMDEVGCEIPFDIMGLLRTTENGQHLLTLYRRPILDYWAEQGEELSIIVGQVMVQETGHQLGLSEEDMAQIETELEAATPQRRTVQ